MAGDTTVLGATATTRASVAAVAGVCAGVLVGLASSWQIGTLVGWDLAAGVYVAWRRRRAMPTSPTWPSPSG